MKVLVIVGLVLAPIVLIAQKRILSLPFEFEKRLLATSDYDAYFLDNKADSVFSLILKDNRKAEYVLLDKNLKILSKIDLELPSTVFTNGIEYCGGTTNGKLFNFIYKKSSGFELETVDYNTKTVTHRSLHKIPSKEMELSTFSDNNTFYTITADNNAKELAFYMVNGAGVMTQKHLSFKMPETAIRAGRPISVYLKNLQVIKTDEEPDLSSAVASTKLISLPGSFTFMVHKDLHPIHLFTVQFADFSTRESFIDLSSFKKDSKEKILTNSFKKGELLFSLICNYTKKILQLVIHNTATGELIASHEINLESDLSLFAQKPMSSYRYGKISETKEITLRKLLFNMDEGERGIIVTPNNKGQYIVTIGTYDMAIKGSSGGWSGGWVTTAPTSFGGSATPTVTYNPSMYYRPGYRSYVSASNYYTTSFRLLLDSTDYKNVKGNVPVPVPNQVREYLQNADPKEKLKATNQFSIGERQYFGYYDTETMAYVVDEIQLKN